MQEKKELILEAALSLFSEGNNINNIKVSDIANKAGIGKGTVYEYFGSKDEIFAQSVIYFAEKQKKIFMSSIGDKDFKTEFFSIMKCIGEIINANRPLFGMLFLSNQTYKLRGDFEDTIKHEIRNILCEVITILSVFVLKGQEENIISKSITEMDVFFAFLSICSVLNHYDEINQNFLKEKMQFKEMCEFCYEKFVKILK